MRRVLVLVALAAFALAAGDADAAKRKGKGKRPTAEPAVQERTPHETRDDNTLCNGGMMVTADDQIRGCSALLKRRLTRDAKATIFYNRGNAYVAKNDFRRAISDYTEALALKSDYPQALVQPGGGAPGVLRSCPFGHVPTYRRGPRRPRARLVLDRRHDPRVGPSVVERPRPRGPRRRLHARARLGPDEIASKTQVFSERYIVDWLLHNSLGPLWLAICEHHGWTADAVADGTLDRLERRRVDWRARRDRGELAPTVT